jgi:hypothetical protein
MAGRPLWTLDADGGKIRKSFVAKSFVAAMDFMNKVAEIAEHEGVSSLRCLCLPPSPSDLTPLYLCPCCLCSTTLTST